MRGGKHVRCLSCMTVMMPICEKAVVEMLLVRKSGIGVELATYSDNRPV